MADTAVISANYETVWGKKAIRESYASAGAFDGLMETITDKEQLIPTQGKPIIVSRTFSSQSGYRQSVPMLGKLSGEGVDGDNTLEGNEKDGVSYAFTVDVDQKRQAIRTKGRMDVQRSSVKLYQHFKPLLSDWQKEIRAKEITRKAVGATSKTWSNTPTAATTNRVLFGGDATATTDVDSADKLDLTVIDKVRLLANNEYIAGTDGAYIPPIGRVDLGGGKNFVGILFVHPAVYFDLLESARVQYMLEHSGAYQKNNPLIKGGDIVYVDIVVRPLEYLRESNVGQFTTWGSGSDQPGAANLFMGACAIAIPEANDPRMVDEGFDYKNKRGMSIDCIWGVQKYKYNGEDLGTILVKTYRTSGI